MKTTDINPERSEKYHYLDKLNFVPKLIILATVAMIISMLALMMSWMAVYDSTHVKIQQQVVLESNADVKMEVRLLQMKVDRYEAKLESKGDN